MISRTLLAAGVALLTGQLVSAQTSSACNPFTDTCPANPALGTSVTFDFTKGLPDGWTAQSGDLISYGSNGAAFTINAQKQAPTIVLNKYVFYGKLEVVLQAAPGAGICTAVVLLSDDLGEIDWEWIGSQAVVQTNYFPGHANNAVVTYGRDTQVPVSAPTTTFHTYTVDWSKDAMIFSIDGAVVRTVTRADAGVSYPQTPMQVKLGTWNPGFQGNDAGTVAWAGGYTNFADAPFVAYYKSVTVTDYGNGVTGATSYTYTDHSGTDASIKIEGGSGTPNTPSSASSSAASSASSAASSTSAAASTSAPASTTLSTSATSPATTSGSVSSGRPSTTSGVAGGAASPTPSTTGAPSTGAAAKSVFSNVALLVAGAAFSYLML